MELYLFNHCLHLWFTWMKLISRPIRCAASNTTWISTGFESVPVCMLSFVQKMGVCTFYENSHLKPYDCSIVHHVKTGELHAALTTVTSLIVLLLHERFLKCPFIPHKSKHLKTPRVSFLKRLSSVALLCNTKEKKITEKQTWNFIPMSCPNITGKLIPITRSLGLNSLPCQINVILVIQSSQPAECQHSNSTYFKKHPKY